VIIFTVHRLMAVEIAVIRCICSKGIINSPFSCFILRETVVHDFPCSCKDVTFGMF
jgi:hypothetical protein